MHKAAAQRTIADVVAHALTPPGGSAGAKVEPKIDV
jgi:hypothetical protein